jgi:hypothetical protein
MKAAVKQIIVAKYKNKTVYLYDMSNTSGNLFDWYQKLKKGSGLSTTKAKKLLDLIQNQSGNSWIQSDEFWDRKIRKWPDNPQIVQMEQQGKSMKEHTQTFKDFLIEGVATTDGHIDVAIGGHPDRTNLYRLPASALADLYRMDDPDEIREYVRDKGKFMNDLDDGDVFLSMKTKDVEDFRAQLKDMVSYR